MGAVGRDSCVVDQRIDLIELPETGDVYLVRHVELQRRHVQSLALERLSRLLAPGEISSAQQHRVIEPPELTADLEADTTISSCDQRDRHEWNISRGGRVQTGSVASKRK